MSIVHKKGFRQMRISGNEPTLSREHLIGVLDLVPRHILFILETNGILIGYDRTYAEDLARYKNIHVRVSFKGCTGAEFSALTGSEPKGFDMQLQALENLNRAGVKAYPAAMISFSSPESIRTLRSQLGNINKEFEDIEIEELVLYGNVEDRLRRAKLMYNVTHSPSCIPPDQV